MQLINISTKRDMSIRFQQSKYPSQLYSTETERHRVNVLEYNNEVLSTLINSINLNRPNLELYSQQPYLTFAIRTKLIDFLLKMSTRLKILPFVFFRAVKIFDRYCSKRVVLLDQCQLIITTCLWIAAKVQGGNNHFVNLNNVNKLADVKTISDLGYGSGGRYLGPTERFRLPKLHELVKLCGAKCKYDQGMFRQMELHVLSTLEWSLNDPSIEEFLVQSSDFSINAYKNSDTVSEIFRAKQYLSYVSLYSNELIDCDVIDLSKSISSLINELLNLSEGDPYHQRINFHNLSEEEDFFYEDDVTIPLPIKHSPSKLTQTDIKRHLATAITNSSDFILRLFDSAGPQQVFNSVAHRMLTVPRLNEYMQVPRSNHYHSLSPSSPLKSSNFSSAASASSLASSPLRVSPTLSLPQRKRPITNNTATLPPTTTSMSFKRLLAHNTNNANLTSTGHSTNYSHSKGTNIPPPHQIGNFNAFPTLTESAYQPAVLPSVLLKFGSNLCAVNDLTPASSRLPPLITINTALNNNSQASLHSQCSSRNDHGSIFEYESTNSANVVGTPMSGEGSPQLPMMKIR